MGPRQQNPAHRARALPTCHAVITRLLCGARQTSCQCVFCGSLDHGIKACRKYDSRAHIPKGPEERGGEGTKHFLTARPSARWLWCLHCGTNEHATCDCKSDWLGLIWPDEEAADHMHAHWHFCGCPQHNVTCLRHVLRWVEKTMLKSNASNEYLPGPLCSHQRPLLQPSPTAFVTPNPLPYWRALSTPRRALDALCRRRAGAEGHACCVPCAGRVTDACLR